MRKLFPVLLAALLLSSPASAKSLHWRDLAVDARLDAAGRLHVREKQTIVFDGDWNGGERRFFIRHEQSFELTGVTRIAEDRSEVPLIQGGIESVDHYALLEGDVLRWRSRLPEDPPFERKAITYRIDYTLGGILRREGTTYYLAHDFAFPDRAGIIERFTLNLVLDPAWGGSENPVFSTHRNLLPGEAVVVRRELTYRGAGIPAEAVSALPRRVTRALAILLATVLAGIGYLFLREEAARGRFAPLIDPGTIDPRWLEENLFPYAPEVAGAAWDQKVGPAEVAAVLARMTQEGKIATHVERKGLFRRPVLHLRLLQERRRFTGYEYSLVTRLFLDGRMETDTDAIRQRYKGIGLDLAALLRAGLENEAGLRESNIARANARRNTMALALTAAAMIALAIVYPRPSRAFLILSLVLGSIASAVSALAARANRRALTAMPLRFALVLLPFVLVTMLMVSSIWNAHENLLALPAILGQTAWLATLLKVILDFLKTTEPPERIAFRKRLASARRYFARQLRSREPRLRDEWLPYLLAFGLGRNVDRWFSRHGGASLTGGSSAGSGSGSAAASASGGGGWSFSGGGGAFGGAGATGSWAVAAGALAAGVSAPSSSGGGGSSGGGSSSSSSSGGGGGGGW